MKQKGNLLIIVVIGVVVAMLATGAIFLMTKSNGVKPVTTPRNASPSATASAQSGAPATPVLSEATDDASLARDLQAVGGDINLVDSEASAVLGIATQL